MSSLNVMPLRYSHDPQSMIRFLTVLGLVPEVSTDSFAILRAGAGRVMLHGVAGAEAQASARDTVLCLATDVADRAADELRNRGLDVEVWDESYGRQAMVTSPAGGAVWINEEMTDLYGYEGHAESAPDSRLVVTAVLPTGDFDAHLAFFETLGFRAGADGDEHWQALRSEGGVVGLHGLPEDWEPLLESDDPRHRFPRIHLGFETSEPVEALAERLREAGYGASVVDDGVLPARVHVVDPDGEDLEIHPSPAAG